MSQQLSRKGLNRSLAAFGLSLAALTTGFNVQASDNVTGSVAITNSSAAPVSQPLDQKLKETINEIGQFLSAQQKDPAFNPLTNQGLQSRVDTLKAIIESGANPNNYVPDTLSLAPDRSLTPIGAAILIAAKARRPDLVQSFIDKGADLRLRSDRGWGPMDYAIAMLIQAQENPNNLAPSTTELQNAVRIVKILNTAGLRTTDATVLTNNSKARTQNYATLATRPKSEILLKVNGFVLRHILHEQGLLSNSEFEEEIKGDRTNAASLLSDQGLTDKNLKLNGGLVRDDNQDLLPGGYRTFRVVKGSTILAMVKNFSGMMGAANTQQALDMLAAQNHIALSAAEAAQPLTESREFQVPVSPANQFGFTQANENESVREIAARVQNIYYKRNASLDEIAADIARMNSVDPAEIDNKKIFQKDEEIIIVYANNSYAHLPNITAPAGAPVNRKVDLVLVESITATDSDRDGTLHSRETFAVAASATYGLNHKADMNRLHRLDDSLTYFPAGDTAKGPSNALKILMSAGNTPLRDRLIFSVSEVQTTDWEKAEGIRSVLGYDNIAYEGIRLMVPNLEQSKPAVFLGAGNSRVIEGPFIQSHTPVHSPRSTLVGAVGQYKINPSVGGTATVIAPYSSYGADVCGQLPMQLDRQREGTSIIAPDLGAVARQFDEWYGDRLSFEEIKAAGLMTADRNLLDSDDPLAMKAIVLSRGGETNKETIKTHTAKFNSNGGGLPHNTYCGAGTINVERWKKNLDTLLTLKRSGQDAEGRAVLVPAGMATPAAIPGSDKQIYTYRLRVPQDMTLGRLTFLLPQDRERHGEVVVKTPAGFELQLPHAITDVVSTDAFSYEDVKAGDIIEIRTNYPLGDTAGLVLRGQAPGNAIAILRDKLRAEGVLPAPVKEMEGNRVTGPSKPVTVLRDQKITYPGFGRD